MKLQDVLRNLNNEIKSSLKQLNYFNEEIPFTLEVPKQKENGDYSTNVALQYAKIARKNPMVIAQEIIDLLPNEGLFITEIKIAKPGFINFYLDKSFLVNIIPIIIQKEDEFGTQKPIDSERYNVEFVSVNPTGSLHIGHARGAAVGDSLCRIMRKAGYDVTKEYYVNDAGNQIHNLALSIETRYKELFDQSVKMPEDGYHGQEIIEAAKAIKKDVGDKYLTKNGYDYFRSYGVESLLANLRHDLKNFRVEFDEWFHETTLYEENLVQETVSYLKEKGYTYEEDGATWLKTSDFNDEKDRVIIKSDKTFTYLTPDIAYHKNKLDRGYTKLIDILGGDHHGYIDRLTAAIEMVSGKEDVLDVEILQMVKVLQDGKEVKMSKRSGKAITLRDLIDEVGVDPIRYFFAMRSLNTHMDLDLDLALKQTNENPVYYVQYAHARIHSIFDKAKEEGYSINTVPDKFLTLTSEKAYDLLSQLASYPDAVSQSALHREPHRLTTYLHNLASIFHSYYNSEQIVSDDSTMTTERLALLQATRIVIKDALQLIGVSAPTNM